MISPKSLFVTLIPVVPYPRELIEWQSINKSRLLSLVYVAGELVWFHTSHEYYNVFGTYPYMTLVMFHLQSHALIYNFN